MKPMPLFRSASFELPLSAEQALPLFTAEGERRWVPGWSPDILSGAHEQGSVFRTQTAEGVRTWWVATDYDATAGRVAYARVAEGSHVGLVQVQVDALAPQRCRVTVRYTLTPISEAGERFVAELLDEREYPRFIAGWGEKIQAALFPA